MIWGKNEAHYSQNVLPVVVKVTHTLSHYFLITPVLYFFNIRVFIYLFDKYLLRA